MSHSRQWNFPDVFKQRHDSRVHHAPRGQASVLVYEGGPKLKPDELMMGRPFKVSKAAVDAVAKASRALSDEVFS